MTDSDPRLRAERVEGTKTRRPNVGVARAKVGDHRHGRPTADLETLRPARRMPADDPPKHCTRASRQQRITDGRAVRPAIAQVPPDWPGERSFLRDSVARRAHLFHISLNQLNPTRPPRASPDQDEAPGLFGRRRGAPGRSPVHAVQRCAASHDARSPASQQSLRPAFGAPRSFARCRRRTCLAQRLSDKAGEIP